MKEIKKNQRRSKYNAFDDDNDKVILEQCKIFKMDEDSVWERACKSKEEYRMAVAEEKDKKAKFLRKKGKTSIFIQPGNTASNVQHPSFFRLHQH